MEATTPRMIQTHKVPHRLAAAADPTAILVLDEAGQGGANHEYEVVNLIHGPNDLDNALVYLHVSFQNGPIKEVGINGVQVEHLLAIAQDRLEAFQAGDYANQYGGEALEHVIAALGALHRRTLDRIARQVEGLNQV